MQAVGLPGSQGWLARMQGRGPDGRAEVMHSLQQGAGNRAVARSVFGDLFKETAESLVDRAMCFTLKGSVGGREADNDPEDVRRVRARLKTLGYPTTDDPATLVAAIERYQRDVVGLKRPDGRIDPAGRTLTALNAGKAAAPVGAPTVPGAAPPELPAAPDRPSRPRPRRRRPRPRRRRRPARRPISRRSPRARPRSRGRWTGSSGSADSRPRRSRTRRSRTRRRRRRSRRTSRPRGRSGERSATSSSPRSRSCARRSTTSSLRAAA